MFPENYLKTLKSMANGVTVFKGILFESKHFVLFDEVKIKIMRYLYEKIYSVKAKSMAHVVTSGVIL